MIYQEFNKFIFRNPTLSLSELTDMMEDRKSPITLFFQQNIQQAIYIASPSLYNEVSKFNLRGAVSENKRNKIQGSLAKFLVRMATRCTPFGLFSGCAIGSVSESTEIRINREYSLSHRLDMEILCKIHDILIESQIVREESTYYPNPSLYKIGKYFRYIENTNIRKGKSQVSQTRYNRTLNAILKKSKSGATFTILKQYLVDAGFSEEDSIEYLNELITNDLLFDELYYSVTGKEYLSKIIEKFRDRCTTYLSVTLKQVETIISTLNTTPSENISKYKEIDSIIGNLLPDFFEGTSLQVDLYNNSSKVEIGKKVINEIKSTIEFLNKLIPYKGNERLQKFINKFSERFEKQEIPLLLAMDPDFGLNYPVDEIRNDSPFIIEGIRNGSESRAKKRIIDIIIAKIKNDANASQITLTDKDVEGVKGNWKHYSDTMSAFFSILNSEGSGPSILFYGFFGDSAAKLLGRFTPNDEIFSLVQEVTNFEKRVKNDFILAEIAHLSKSRTGNVCFRKHLRDYEIVSNVHSDIDGERKIPLNDLYISIKNNELVLRSKRLNKVIIPKLTNAHNYMRSRSPIYKFLCDVASSKTNQALSLEQYIGVNEVVDFQPRIVYKETVLSPAMWYVKTLELKNIIQQSSDTNLIKRIRCWRDNRSIPNRILITDEGSKVYVDLESILSINSISSVLNKREYCIMFEFLEFKHKDISFADGRPIVNECILPFYKMTNAC